MKTLANRPSLHEVVDTKYGQAIHDDQVARDVVLRTGRVVPEVALRDPETHWTTRIVKTPWAYRVAVGSDHPDPRVTLSLGQGVTFDGDPLRLVIEPRKTMLVGRDSLIRLGSSAMTDLAAVVERSASTPAGGSSINQLRAENLAQNSAEGSSTSVHAILGGILMASSIYPDYIHVEPATEPELVDHGFVITQARLLNRDLSCLTLAEGLVNLKDGELLDESGMFTMSFPHIEAWDTLEGTIITSDLSAVVEGTEVLVENGATEAGFSHLAANSLVRVQEILTGSNFIPYN